MAHFVIACACSLFAGEYATISTINGLKHGIAPRHKLSDDNRLKTQLAERKILWLYTHWRANRHPLPC